MPDAPDEAPPRGHDPVVAFARSLTVRGLARALLLVGACLAVLATYRLVAIGADPRSWVRLGCAVGWLALGTWTLRGTERRRTDWRARGRAPVVVVLWALVFGPIATSVHGVANLADLMQTILTGPTLGLCMLLDGLLLRESVVTREDA